MAKRIDRKVKRGIIYKMCGRCHSYVPESEFNRASKHTDQLQCYCRNCNIAYCREWHDRRRLHAQMEAAKQYS